MFCLVFVLNTKFTHHSHHIISSYRLRFSYGFISICLYVQSILSRWRHQETNNIIPHQPLKLSHWNSHSQDMTLNTNFMSCLSSIPWLLGVIRPPIRTISVRFFLRRKAVKSLEELPVGVVWSASVMNLTAFRSFYKTIYLPANSTVYPPDVGMNTQR